MRYRLRYLAQAEQDIKAAFDYLAPRAGLEVAIRMMEETLATCEGLRDFPLRGAPRDHVRRGLRITSLKRSITIAYAVMDRDVVILRILGRGQDLGQSISDRLNEGD